MPRRITAVVRAALLTAALIAACPAAASSPDTPTPPPTIGLALGSGGANGLAHIAILQVFDDLGIVPYRIVGSSIGAVIGGLYAAGLPAATIRDIFDDVAGSPLDALSGLAESEVELTALVPFGGDDAGLLDAAGFLRFLAGHTEVRTFAELRIPLEVVTTDYWTGESVILDEGLLFPAIEASMAVPGLFLPAHRGEQLLIDGGISNPLPYGRLHGVVDWVVAVDVSGSRELKSREELGLSDMLFNSFKIMQQAIIQQSLQHRPPDLYLRPEAPGVRLLHFNRIDAILRQAEPDAEQLREQLASWLDPPATPSP